MDFITIFQKFPDTKSCIAYLEKIRWGAAPKCAYCESEKGARKTEGTRVARWSCSVCRSSFSVLVHPCFAGTKIPRQNWFLAIVSELITDEYPPYNAFTYVMPHSVLNYHERFADGEMHTNTIEGFWSLLKRAGYG